MIQAWNAKYLVLSQLTKVCSDGIVASGFLLKFL